MMHFSVNMLFKRMLSLGATEEDSQYALERVLWIDPSHTFLYTIDCDVQHRNAWPVARRIADLEGDLRSGLISHVVEDPYQYIYQKDEAFPPEYLRKRKESWDLVQMILSRAETPGMLFDPHILGPIIAKLHKNTGKAKTTLYRLLRYYWQKGQVENALLPNFDLCGAPGETRKSGSAKRGRPSKTALEKGVPTGVNIDDTDKEFFRQGIQLDYETRECKTLKEAWLRTLAMFYAIGEKECDGVKYPVLPGWEKLPTLNQFRYWYYKEYHPVRAIVKRQGEHAYTVNKRAARGSLRLKVFGPGSIYIIDATVGDIYLQRNGPESNYRAAGDLHHHRCLLRPHRRDERLARGAQLARGNAGARKYGARQSGLLQGIRQDDPAGTMAERRSPPFHSRR